MAIALGARTAIMFQFCGPVALARVHQVLDQVRMTYHGMYGCSQPGYASLEVETSVSKDQYAIKFRCAQWSCALWLLLEAKTLLIGQQ